MKITQMDAKSKRLRDLLSEGIDTKLEMLCHFLELVRLFINDLLEEDVRSYCGDRYSRERPYGGSYVRWGTNPGSVFVGNQRIRIEVPRVYDREGRRHIPLEYYRKLRERTEVDEHLTASVLLGLNMGDYGRVVPQLLDSFGLSRSSVSRHFIRESREKLREFEERRLDAYRILALFIDGKEFEKEQIVIVLGVTEEGRKIPLGFIQSHTENGKAIAGLLRNLVDRGLRIEEGILCVMDGSRGIRKAVEEVFGPYAVIQRCQWHKRENIVGYLSKSDADQYRRRLNQAYNLPTYAEAKGALLAIREELLQKNLSAARSVEEGLEETLTLHCLGLYEWFGKSFSTTNCIENLNSQLVKYTGRVKRWRSSDQRHRWIACALLEIEARMRRVDHYFKLPLMRKAIKEEITKKLKEQKINSEPPQEFQLKMA